MNKSKENHEGRDLRKDPYSREELENGVLTLDRSLEGMMYKPKSEGEPQKTQKG